MNKDLAKPGSDGPVNSGNGTDTKGKQCMENIQDPRQIWINICQIEVVNSYINICTRICNSSTHDAASPRHKKSRSWATGVFQLHRKTPAAIARARRSDVSLWFIMLVQSSLDGEALVICVRHTT